MENNLKLKRNCKSHETTRFRDVDVIKSSKDREKYKNKINKLDVSPCHNIHSWELLNNGYVYLKSKLYSLENKRRASSHLSWN